ncbi:hypothetical protein UABAM_04508 [Candidatus Uabimicrobium amorphum]|uniref:Uncharacterized protein n=1 Tax=Uabimicrobium amorphum TaxID=2596890 RepID=A0A5S9IRI3_UABAM|nr:hypothetical protein UABAM_04508 [Candidatus Uabimicrobium amorphum]
MDEQILQRMLELEKRMNELQTESNVASRYECFTW